MKRLTSWLAIIAAAAILTACNNNNGNVVPTPGPTCSPGNGASNAFLVYPAGGSTVAGASVKQIVVATQGASLPNTWDVVITDALNPAGAGSDTPFQPASPPFPSPNATPPYASPFYQSAPFASGFAGGQIVSVFVNNTSTACTPAGPIGSFTTT